LLSRQDFSRLVLDYLVFANGYLEKRMSVTGQLLKLETSPAKYTRRGVEDGVYWYVSSFTTRTSSPPVRCFTCLSLISIRSSTGCRNT
jgi:hypothetical protein